MFAGNLTLMIMEAEERIITGATKLFMEHGVKNVTMDDIATYLGMSKRTIYEKFANKKELLVACIDHQYQIHEQEHEAINEKHDNIFESIFHTFNNKDEQTRKMRKFGEEIRRLYPEIIEDKFEQHCNKAIDKLINGLEKGKKQGLIKMNINVEFASYVVLEALYGVVSRPEVVPHSKITKSNAVKFIVIYFFRGISSERGIKVIDELIDKHYRQR